MRRLCLLAGCGGFCARRMVTIMGHAMASCEIRSRDTAWLAHMIVRTSGWSKSGRPIAPDRKRSAAHHHQQQPRTSFKARPAPKFVASAAQAAHFGSQNLLSARCGLALECLFAVRVAVVACFLLLRTLIGVCTYMYVFKYFVWFGLCVASSSGLVCVVCMRVHLLRILYSGHRSNGGGRASRCKHGGGREICRCRWQGRALG